MNPFATIRQRQARWARRVLGLFVVVWLNMALQPCAMAFSDMTGHDCVHCPPAYSSDANPHSVRDLPDADSGATPCDISTSQCGFIDDYQHDGRTAKVKVKDAPSDMPVGIAPAMVVAPFLDTLDAQHDICDISYLPGTPPPLNVLHCVYLK